MKGWKWTNNTGIFTRNSTTRQPLANDFILRSELNLCCYCKKNLYI